MPRAPIGGVACLPAQRSPVTVLKNGNVVRLRFEIGKRGLQLPRSRLHREDDETGDRPERVARTCPVASSSAAIASSEIRGPESVIERGPLKAEIVTVRSCRAMRAKLLPQAEPTASIVPSPHPQRFHETCAKRDDPGCFLERQNSGDAGSRDFSHAMTDDGRRLERPRLSRAPRAPLAWRKWPAVQSPFVASGMFLRSGRVLREARSWPTDGARRRNFQSPRETPAHAASIRAPFPTSASLVRS